MAVQRLEAIVEPGFTHIMQAVQKGTTPEETSTVGTGIKQAGIAATEIRLPITIVELGH
jgi:hypothetical protein